MEQWAPRRLTRAQLEDRRREAVRLFRTGTLSQAEIARRLGVTPAAVSQWRTRWRHGGVRRGTAARRAGADRTACPPHYDRLGPPRPAARPRGDRGRLRYRALDARPDRGGDRARVRGDVPPALSGAPAQGARLHAASPGDPGPGTRRVRDRAVADEGLGGAEQKAGREGRTLVLVDETGHTFRAKTGTTWARRGTTPVLRRVSKRREVSSIVGITPDGRLAARHFRGAVDSDRVMLALRYFQRRLGRRLLVVWDRLNAHRSRATRRFLERHVDIAVAYLPAYAPERNPEEQCNAWVKGRMANALPGSVDELAALARRGFRCLQRDPATITSFFHHAGLRC